MRGLEGGIGRRLGAVLAVALCAAPPASVRAEPPPGTGADRRTVVPIAAPAGEDWDRLCLGIAVHRWRRGDVSGAVQALEWRDRTDRDDRADFLFAAGLRSLGDRDAFLREAGRLEGRESEFATWLGTIAWLDTLETSATDARTRQALETVRRDVEAADRLRRAAVLLADGRSAEELLGDGAEGTAYERRTRHVQGLSLLERGRRQEGRAVLETLWRGDRAYEGRRDVGRALAFLALEEGRFGDAHAILTELEAGWRAEREELTRLANTLDEATVNRLWNRWIADAGLDGLRLDRRPLEEAFGKFTERALDLRGRPAGPEPPAPELVAGRAARPSALPLPDSAAVAAVDRAGTELARARLELARRVRAWETEREAIAREAAYFERGVRATGAAVRDAAAVRAWTDSLRARGDDIAAALDFVRDEALRRVAVRVKDFRRRLERHRLLARSLQHYWIEGPAGAEDAFPLEGEPGAEDVLQEEEVLVADLENWVATFAERTPPLVHTSHATIWRPRATEGPLRLGRVASDLDRRARTVLASVDSTRTDVLDASRLATLRARVAEADEGVRALSAEHVALRRRVLADMIDAAAESLRAEGEALAYGLAVASHERSLRQGGTTSLGEKLREAIDRYERFLAEYPAAPARSEIRYRLADARMAVAREDFRRAMARFVGDGSAPSATERAALAPFVDYGPALALYRAILEDDPDWRHRDAALFHAGMILSDEGDPEAFRVLEELVDRFPSSEHAQEAHLRLGDDLFLRREFAASVPHFEKAAAGDDPEHAAIALYKAGWAHYNRDGFRSGADAFRRLLDLYEEHPHATRTTDLRREAEEYLVHCLARAGGVSAFVELFDGVGPRPYEADTLTRLGHLLRRFSLFDEAAAADRLWLERYGDRPDALAAVQRLAQTLERAGRPEAAREALLEWAPHFFYGSSWHRANPDPARQREAAEFAQDAYLRVALHYHHRARETNDPRDWQRALDLYGQVVARWPTGAAAPTFHFHAGEAAEALGQWEEAISHFESAAASDTASFAADAAWQAIAVRDRWYESSRPDPGGTGADSLASAVIESVNRFAERHGTDPRTGALLWRKGHLAIAHGQPGAAAAAFGEIVRDHPDDEHSPLAERYRAQSFYDAEEFQAAGLSFAKAVILARKTGQDSLALALSPLVPHCSFRHAEQMQEKDPGESGRLFEELAARWPTFTLADQALYRAGLAYGEAERREDALRVLARLLEEHPRSEYRRDAYLVIADLWEEEERPAAAAQTLAGFSEAFPDDPDAPAALLRAADLLAADANPAQAEQLRSLYLERFPDDEATALEILEPRAREDLELVGPGRPISILVDEESEYLPGADLRRYLALAANHDSLAAPDIFARVHYLRGEEARIAYEDVPLTQPLEASIRTKKDRLERILEEMRASAGYGVAPWNRAAAYRIGESLVAFGDALRESERPAGLSGDDLAAYDEVLEEQSWDFFARGEEAWRVLLSRAKESGIEDEWVRKTRTALWPRLSARFLHRPELDWPLVPVELPEGGER